MRFRRAVKPLQLLRRQLPDRPDDRERQQASAGHTQPAANAQSPHGGDESFHESRINALLNEEARAAQTDLALIVEAGPDAGTYGVINYTALGTTMRATFQDRETAMLMGVNVDAIHTLTFAIGSALAGAAGALLGPVFLVTPTMGDLASLKAFAIVILGGLGNITGAAIGGFALAMVEEMGAGYLSSDYRDAMGFVVIIVVLAIRPTGLFARAERVG